MATARDGDALSLRRLWRNTARWQNPDMFVGRARALSRLLDAVEQAADGRSRLVLVRGEAGIGKTTLLVEAARRSGWVIAWGSCVDAEQPPAFWPWTAALRGLLDPVHSHPSGTDAVELSRLVPELAAPGAGVPEMPVDPHVARLRLFDTVARFVEDRARRAPLLLVLDDLHWADESTIALLRFVAGSFRPVPLVVAGAYRPDEPGADTAVRELDDLARRGDLVQLSGLSADEVHELVARAAGEAAAQRWADGVHRRTGGHPFFASQVAELLTDTDPAVDVVPAAVRDLVLQRVERLATTGRAVVDAAAVAGAELIPDVLAQVCGMAPAGLVPLVEEAVRDGVLVHEGASTRFAHDLVRETVVAALPEDRRLVLHDRLAEALEDRRVRGAPVAPQDLARHSASAAPLGDVDRAVRWARAAAEAERSRLAFGEAAAHLARARRAVEEAGLAGTAGVLVDLLVEEADARARTGDPAAARGLLDDARRRAVAAEDVVRLGRTALGVQRLGARFAMPRDAVVEVLDTARAAAEGTGTPLEAELTAALARELHHSVPAQRARAAPLSQRALDLARSLDDPPTLAACLLAHHDVLWTPGRAGDRIRVAREIAELGTRTGDTERHAEGLLLTANAQLEQGSEAFRVSLAGYLRVGADFGQPRHDYLVLTRRAALALIDGEVDDAERLIDEAAALGERIGEPDTGNVRMSQLLGLAHARADPAELRALADEAVRWWVGVPAHAHAVAAGFRALAGEADDLAAARRHLDTVLALGTWREDRSYLWSVFVGSMATAAARLGDREVCSALLAELEPVAEFCGVNGALVCFMGCNAHWAGLAARALGHVDDARRHFSHALSVHRRIGAPTWSAASEAELARLDAGPQAGGSADQAAALVRDGEANAELRCVGEMWLVRYGDETAHLRPVKGLPALAALLARPGTDIHVLDLVGPGPRDRDSAPVLDAAARAAYRARLAELDDESDRAHAAHDLARAEQLDRERDAVLAELARAAGIGGRNRGLGSTTTERARKAVSARLRDAIGRISVVVPELGRHLDRSVVTGSRCRYQPVEPLRWRLR